MESDFPDYYAILQVSRDASANTIRTAYIRSVREWHPDKFTIQGVADQQLALRRTISLNEAYSVLGDEARRAAYDELLREWDQARRQLAVVVSACGQGNYRSLGEAVASVDAGTRILIEPGFYAESVILDRAVRLSPTEGTGSVTIDGSATVRASGVGLRGLRLRSISVEAIRVQDGSANIEHCTLSTGSRRSTVEILGPAASATLQHVAIDGGGDGVRVLDGAKAILDSCCISDVARTGISVSEGSSATIRGVAIRGCGDAGIAVMRGAQIAADDCEVSHVGTNGFDVDHAHRADILRCKVSRARAHGVRLRATVATVVDSETRLNRGVGIEIAGGEVEVRASSVNHNNRGGILAHSQACVTLEQSQVHGNTSHGIIIDGFNTGAAIRTTTVLRNNGRGIIATGRCRITVRDSHIADNRSGDVLLRCGATINGPAEAIQLTLLDPAWDPFIDLDLDDAR